MRKILILLSVFVINQSAFANVPSEMDAIRAALESRNDFVSALKTRDFTAITHQAFDVAIRELAQQLREEHHDDLLADDLLMRWTQSSANFAGEIASMLGKKELGDHDPLFPWIQDFLNNLGDKYGTIIFSLPIVQNIVMLNYAIPVVFSPHGTWQTAEANNRIEYRKHFIPFANIVTYYVSLYGCKYVLAQQGVTTGVKQLCTKAATKLQHVMGRYIAPVVSDWIFKSGNQSLEIGADRLRYTTAEELQQAIQN